MRRQRKHMPRGYKFTRRQVPGALLIAGGFAWSVYQGGWAGYLIGLGCFYAGAIAAMELVKWNGRRRVRRLLAEKPYLAYLVAIHDEFGTPGKEN